MLFNIKRSANLASFIVVLCCYNCYAQFGLSQEISNAGGNEIGAFDLDGDSDLDVLICSDANVVWYENLDGEGTFGPQQVINFGLSNGRSVYAADLDGDLDLDVISASAGPFGQLEWYENLDGNGNFGIPFVVESLTIGLHSVILMDMDGDTDIDILYAKFNSDRIAWYENVNGTGFSWIDHAITSNADGAYSVFATDIDGDTDIDVLSASQNDNKIAWYENTDGTGNFGSQNVITTNAMEAYEVFAIDIDGDLDMDVLSASVSDNKIAWYENTDGLGNFGAEQIISVIAIGARSVHAADFDGDDDIDVVSGDLDISTGEVNWYENLDGNGSFSTPQLIGQNEGYLFVRTADIDGDTDADIIGVDPLGVYWYENLHPLGIGDFTKADIFVYPNPANEQLNIRSDEPLDRVEIYSILGQKVKSISIHGTKLSIDMSDLTQGTFFVNVYTRNLNQVFRIIKK